MVGLVLGAILAGSIIPSAPPWRSTENCRSHLDLPLRCLRVNLSQHLLEILPDSKMRFRHARRNPPNPRHLSCVRTVRIAKGHPLLWGMDPAKTFTGDIRHPPRARFPSRTPIISMGSTTSIFHRRPRLAVNLIPVDLVQRVPLRGFETICATF